MAALTDREQQVINWSTQEIDGAVKLGDKIAELEATDGGSFTEVAHAEVDHTDMTGILSTPATNQVASTAIDVAGIVADFNTLLGKLKTAGLMAADV